MTEAEAEGMSWTVEDAGEFVVVRTRGTFNTSDHVAMVQDVVGRSFWEPGRHALFDHRELSFSRAGYHAMARAVQTHATQDDQIGAGRAAILMGKLADFGVGRIFEAVAEGQVTARLRIFRDEDEARRWVGEGEDRSR